MTEHALHFQFAAPAAGLDLSRSATAEASRPWEFRSIREAAEPAPAAKAQAAPRLDFHHRAERPAPVRRNLAGAGGFMTIPRLFRGAPAQARPVAQRVSAFDIYTGHFGLTSRPFTLVPDPDFLFWSNEHRSAFAMLEFGVVTGAPITMITGEIGAGKTTLIQQLLRTMGRDVRVGLISNTGGDPTEILRWVLMSLGQAMPSDQSHQGLMGELARVLAAERAAGRRVVLIFDEAQNLDAAALEGLRLLTNINADKSDCLQLVLVGQPELRDLVMRPSIYQFAQRVVASFHLSAMDCDSTRAYIAHRLKVAGLEANIFSEAACQLIHEATGGIPRRINQLCDLAMVYAFTADAHAIVRSTVLQVLTDGVFFDPRPAPPAAPRQAEPALQ